MEIWFLSGLQCIYFTPPSMCIGHSQLSFCFLIIGAFLIPSISILEKMKIRHFHKGTDCVEYDGTIILPDLKDIRDCQTYMGPTCSVVEPCTTCDVEKMLDMGITDTYSHRCSTCTRGNNGDCEFEIGVGPYCRKDDTGFLVEACKKCCSKDIDIRSCQGANLVQFPFRTKAVGYLRIAPSVKYRYTSHEFEFSL